MSDRYIRRFALPQRLYTDGAPVVLAAGVLLEDTRSPRLVAQLKWKSVDRRTVTALTVSVRCPDTGGADTVFTYKELRAVRGQAFGQYTAVVLPWSDAQSMEVRAVSAVFGDGTVWTAPEDARWKSLPAFTALDEAVGDASLLALSRGLPSSRYAYWSGQGIWYCACGGVNRDGETTCHRCGCQRETAARLATAAGLAAVRQAQLDEAARQAQERAQRAAEARQQRAARRPGSGWRKSAPGSARKRRRLPLERKLTPPVRPTHRRQSPAQGKNAARWRRSLPSQWWSSRPLRSCCLNWAAAASPALARRSCM